MKLSTPAPFYDALRTGLLGPTLTASEVTGLDALLSALTPWPLAWAAYGLATAYHETAHTLQPVIELGGEAYFRRRYDPAGLHPEIATALGNTTPGDGAMFCGRGYVQLTGRANYARADRALGLDGHLIADPDLALDPRIAARILEGGMREGWFTGRKLSAFFAEKGVATRAQFMSARRIINGQDRADIISDYALRFQDALQAGGWA